MNSIVWHLHSLFMTMVYEESLLWIRNIVSRGSSRNGRHFGLAVVPMGISQRVNKRRVQYSCLKERFP